MWAFFMASLFHGFIVKSVFCKVKKRLYKL